MQTFRTIFFCIFKKYKNILSFRFVSEQITKISQGLFGGDLKFNAFIIVYALNELEQALSISIRKTTWLPLDEVWESLLNVNPNITGSSIYRTLCRNEINKVPQKEREKAKKFKEYEPGVKTPFQAVEKWFMLKTEIFKQNPCIFKNKILCLQPKCDKKSIK